MDIIYVVNTDQERKRHHGEIIEDTIVDCKTLEEHRVCDCTVECIIQVYHPGNTVYGIRLEKTIEIDSCKGYNFSKIIDKIVYKCNLSEEYKSKLIQAFTDFYNNMNKKFAIFFRRCPKFEVNIWKRGTSKILGSYEQKKDELPKINLYVEEHDDLDHTMYTVFLHEIGHYMWENLNLPEKPVFLNTYLEGKETGEVESQEELVEILKFYFKKYKKGGIGDLSKQNIEQVVNQVLSVLKREFKLSKDDVKALVINDEIEQLLESIPESIKFTYVETNIPSTYGRTNSKEYFCEALCNYYYNYVTGEVTERYPDPIPEELADWFSDYFKNIE